MATQWVILHVWSWYQGLYGGPNGIYHFGVKRAHDVGNLHLVVGGWGSTPILSGATTTTGGWSPIRAGSKAAVVCAYWGHPDGVADAPALSA